MKSTEWGLSVSHLYPCHQLCSLLSTLFSMFFSCGECTAFPPCIYCRICCRWCASCASPRCYPFHRAVAPFRCVLYDFIICHLHTTALVSCPLGFRCCRASYTHLAGFSLLLIWLSVSVSTDSHPHSLQHTQSVNQR